MLHGDLISGIHHNAGIHTSCVKLLWDTTLNLQVIRMFYLKKTLSIVELIFLNVPDFLATHPQTACAGDIAR
jgi:hypothetical protein